MIFLVQEPWRASRASEDLDGICRLIDTMREPGKPCLVLAPLAQTEPAAPDRAGMLEALGALARRHDLYLAAAATVMQDGVAAPAGFVFDPAGTVVLEVVKTLPDLVAGYTDSETALYAPRSFEPADTPFGRLGMLIGEDILAPSLARMTAQAGAEIILNPAFERQDSFFEARQRARAARAYENLSMVLCASPSRSLIEGLPVEQLPSATAAYDTIGHSVAAAKGPESLVQVSAPIQAVRRRRSETYANLSVVVRTGLYAKGYAAQTPAQRPVPSKRADWAAEGDWRKVVQSHKASEREDRLDRYDVVMGQMDLVSVHDVADRDRILDHNVSRAIKLTRGMARSPSVKLVVFPEFFMQGVVTGQGLDYWMKVGARIDGPEMDRLKAFAVECSVFVSGMIYEVDPRWPDRYFNTAFIIDDEGKLIHRYRKIHGADTGLLTLTTPGNIYTDYTAEYGYDGLFPVTDTKIGKLATMVCFDVNFPETARALVQRGAEVLIHPTSEPHNARRIGWDIGRRTRAYENLAYLISAGTGGQYNSPDDVVPSPAKRGHSQIVRFDGRVEVIADGSGHLPVMGPVDLGSLREARLDARNNLALWDEPGVYAAAYEAAGERGYPLDQWLHEPMREARQGLAVTKSVITRYFEAGVFTKPSGAPIADQNMGMMYGSKEKAV
jgi:predicted amidohydrolase